MGIQLLSVSHKAASLKIRQLFAFDQEQQLRIMKRLKSSGYIEETVLLSTCNRMELYVYSHEERQVFYRMEQAIIEEIREKTKEETELNDYFRLYAGEKAVHHLFSVAAGLDSMLIGEDQILGQVKQAHTFAREEGMSGVYLNTCFRYAVTGAKKVKTDTVLSKTPVSTAGLAVKAMQEHFGSLKDKKIMLIGSSGKIGTIVLKNLQSMEEINLYVTMRGIKDVESIKENHNGSGYLRIPYEQRYQWMEQMDAVISATSSPHYTITGRHLKEHYKKEKLVLVDLAVPMDIDEKVGQLKGVICYHMDDLKKTAAENNEKKKEEAKAAKRILYDFETQFQKWFLFQQSYGMIEQVSEHLQELISEKGIKKAIRQFFYKIREENEPERLEQFLLAVSNYVENEMIEVAMETDQSTDIKEKNI